ncbi:hypothetical protein [Geobacter sp.]|uniref:hypothetical protein n=1 Tax=Geobacter sp. TaxID=46610 RepID=UPI0026304C42|nr:hypothetical protein [Geobacter sp.]
MAEGKWFKNTTIFFVGTLFLLGGGQRIAAASDEPEHIRELEQKLEKNSQTIDMLSRKLKEVEETMAERKEKEASGSSESLVASTEQPVTPQADNPGAFSFLDNVTWLHGFADVNFGLSSSRKNPDDRIRGFSVGLLDFYLTPHLGDNVKSLAEVIFQIDKQGDVDVMLQRLQLGYTFGDYATLWAGRYHVPLGYWTAAFPHGGRQLQTSLQRPRFINFDEGGIIPTMLNGVLTTGRFAIGEGNLTYDLYGANGVKIKSSGMGGDAGIGGGLLDTDDFKDDNNDFTFGANVGFEFGGELEGLKVGSHWLRGRVDGYDPANTRLKSAELNILGGYAYYNANNWEAIAEFYQFFNKDLSDGSGTHTSSAGFVQVAHTLRRLTPYARFEIADLDQSDSYFNQQANGTSYTREAVGVRYDLTPQAALKLEGNHTSITDRGSENFDELRMQFAIRF